MRNRSVRRFTRSAAWRVARELCSPLEPRRLLCGVHGSIEADLVYKLADLAASMPYDPDTLPRSGGGPEAANIVWVNRGADGFGTYGSSAGTARNLVDRAIDAWNAVYDSLNQQLPFGGESNTVSLTIQAVNLADVPFIDPAFHDALGLGGMGPPLPSANVTGASNRDGTPRSGSITMDDNAGGIGWYFDTSLSSDNDFPTLGDSIWEARGTMSTMDFYSVALHEIGHAIGFGDGRIPDPPAPLPPSHDWAIASRQVDTGLNDSDYDIGEDLIRFSGVGFDATFTGAHLYGGANPPAGSPTHLGFLMNPFVDVGQRRVISSLEASILRDGYGYTRSGNLLNSMAIRFDAFTGQLAVNGEPGTFNDTIKIDLINGDTVIRVSSNGVTEDFSVIDVSSILVDPGAGDDTILIFRNNKPITVLGGTGNDTIELTPGSKNLDNVIAPINFDGGDGSDSATLYDDGAAFNDLYEFTKVSGFKSRISRTAFGGFDLSSVTETLHLLGQPGNNTFNFNGVSSYTRYTIMGGSGDDTFNVGNGSWNAVADGPFFTAAIHLVGEAGTDTVRINDVSDSSGDKQVNLNGNLAQKLLANGTRVALDISYTQHEALVFDGGSDRQFVRVDWTPAGVNTQVNARNGDDEIWLGWNGGNFGDIQGPITVDGGGTVLTGGIGADKVVVFDDFQIDNATFVVTESAVQHAGAAATTLSNLEFIQIETGSGNDTVYLNSLAVPIGTSRSFSFYGNNGDDSLWLANSTGDVGAIDGPVTFVGGNGIDRLFFDDDDHAENVSYTVSSGQVARSGGPLAPPFDLVPASHSTIEEIYVYGPQGNNLFNFSAATLNVRYEIYANGGNDTLRVGNDLDSNFPVATRVGADLLFYGQGGTDAVIIDDSADTTADASETGADELSVYDSFVFKSLPSGGITSHAIQFFQHESLDVTGAEHRTRTDLVSILPGVPTIIDQRGGDDQLRISPSQGNLDNIQSPITIGGGSGTDEIVLFDTGAANDSHHVISSISVTKSSSPFSMSYNAAEVIRLNASLLSNLLNVASTATSVFYDLNTNGGADTINIGVAAINSILGSVSVNGGIGNDTVNIGAGDLDSYLGTNNITLTGGDGNDSVVFDDAIDGPANNATTISSTLVNKNGRIVNHNTMEHLRFDAGGTGGFQFTIPSAIVGTTTINGTAQADTFSVASLPAGATLAINAFNGNDSLTVNASAAGAGIAMNGGDGDDSVTLGTNLLAIQGTTNFVGQLGTDSAILNDSAGTAGARYTFATGTAGRTDAIGTFIGGTLVSNALETLQIIGTTGADSFNNASPMSTTRVALEGRDGNDTFTVLGSILQGMMIDGGNNDDHISLPAGTQWTSPTTLSGGNGNDSLTVDDASLFSASSSYVITDTTLSSSVAPHPINYNSFARVDLLGTSGANTYDHTTTLASTRWYYSGQAGADVFNIRRTFAAGWANINGTATIVDQPGLDILNVTPLAGNVAAAILESGGDFQSITINADGYLGITPSGGTNTLTTRSVSIATGGKWDLNDNAAVIDYTGGTPLAQIEQYVRDGRLSKGVNTGISIDPNARVGIAEMTDIFASSTGMFAGTLVDSTSVLLRYTRVGDSDLDRDVDFDDLLQIAQSYGQANQRWSTGDFSYDGNVDFEDLLLLAQQYGSSLASSPIPPSPPRADPFARVSVGIDFVHRQARMFARDN